MICALGAFVQRAASETKRLALFYALPPQIAAQASQVEAHSLPFGLVAAWSCGRQVWAFQCLELVYPPDGVSLTSIGITVKSIRPLLSRLGTR